MIDADRGESQTTKRLSHELPDESTVQTWEADSGRLADDVGRAIDEMNWGRIKVSVFASDEDSVAGSSDAASDLNPDMPKIVVRARALLADGRTAWIVGHDTNDSRVTVAVRVGYHSSPKDERAYLKQLKQVLKGQPKRQRGGTFELP